MIVYDVLTRSPQGVVVGGTDENVVDVSESRLRELIGKDVQIERQDRSRVPVKVLGVETTTAISGARNVFLLLPIESGIGRGDLGATVLSEEGAL